MIEKIKNFRFKMYYIPFVLLFIYALVINWSAVIQPGDDTVYMESFRVYGGFINWFKNYIALWSGRVLPHLCLIIALNKNIILWKIANSIVFLLLAIGSYLMVINTNAKYTDKAKSIISTIVCGIIFAIPVSVMDSGAIWITGSFNYLWPVTFCILALIPFKRLITGEKCGKFISIIALISALYSSNAEQTAAILIAFSSISVLYAIITKSKIGILKYIFYAVIIVLSVLSLLAPGNGVRSDAEVLKWFSDFDMLSFIDKIFMGVNLAFNHMFNQYTVVMLIITAVMFILVNKKKVDRITSLLSAIPLAYVISKYVGAEKFFAFNATNTLELNIKGQFIPIFSAIVVCLIILYLFFVIFDEYQGAIVGALFFAAAICAIIVLGFSPTIEASGTRIFFVSDIIFNMCGVYLVNYYFEKYDKNQSKTLSILFMVILIATIVALSFFAYKH